MTPAEYLRLVVDPVRLAILGSAACGPVDADRLSADVGKPKVKVLKEIERLRSDGLLNQDNQLDVELLRDLAKRLPSEAEHDPAIVDGPWSAEEQQILSRFFTGMHLVSLPSADAKRRVVLERLAFEFEPGLRYTERHVNSILQIYNEDYATLRRYLVDYGMLTRADGVYWRSGGRFDDDLAVTEGD